MDGLPTIFDRIIGNLAHIKVVNEIDFSQTKGYLVKGNGCVAHGETLQEARADLLSKLMATLNIGERILEFTKEFEDKKSYPADEFFKWHNILTGSCLMGRQSFIKSRNIDMKREYTVKEFIEICENAFGGEIIKKLKVYYGG